MTILMTTDTIGGVWTYALDLAAALDRHGLRVVLATMGPLPTHEQRRKAAEAGVELHESDFRLEWMPAAADDVAGAGEWLLELNRHFQPDIVHLNGYAHAALRWEAPVVVVAHSCVCTWWQAVRGEAAPASWDAYRAAVREGLEAAAAVVAPTEAMLTALQEAHGAVDTGHVIPNGRDGTAFLAGEKQPLVMTAGRMWDEAKNLQTIEAAAAHLPWPVYVAGPDHCEDRHKARTRHVHCLGSLPSTRVAEWMSRASIYVLPARYEPFGLSVVEAALSGCALILADIASLREVWGDAACYVDANDARALRRAIRRYIDEPALMRRMARRARRRARRYTTEAMAQRYMELYETIHRRGGRMEGAYSCES